MQPYVWLGTKNDAESSNTVRCGLFMKAIQRRMIVSVLGTWFAIQQHCGRPASILVAQTISFRNLSVSPTPMSAMGHDKTQFLVLCRRSESHVSQLADDD